MAPPADDMDKRSNRALGINTGQRLSPRRIVGASYVQQAHITVARYVHEPRYQRLLRTYVPPMSKPILPMLPPMLT